MQLYQIWERAAGYIIDVMAVIQSMVKDRVGTYGQLRYSLQSFSSEAFKVGKVGVAVPNRYDVLSSTEYPIKSFLLLNKNNDSKTFALASHLVNELKLQCLLIRSPDTDVLWFFH